MSPEDILLEAMNAAALHGNSAELRTQMCTKLNQSIIAHLREYEILVNRIAPAQETQH